MVKKTSAEIMRQARKHRMEEKEKERKRSCDVRAFLEMMAICKSNYMHRCEN